MAGKIPRLILILLFCLVLTSGCHDIQDINDRMIVTSIGIDARPAGKMAVYFNMPLIRPLQGTGHAGGASETQMLTLGAIASGIYPASVHAQEREDHALFLGQCRSLIFGEEMAGRGIGTTIDFFFRNPMFPPNCIIVVAKPSAKDIIDIQWPEIEMHDQNVRLFFENKENPVPPVKLWQLFQEIHDVMEDPAVPLVKPADGETAIELLGLAIFRDDRMVGELDRDETIVLGELRNHPKDSRLSVSLDGGPPISFHLVDGKTRIKTEWPADGPLCRVSIDLTASLIEAGEMAPLDQEDLERIRARTEGQLKDQALALLRKLQALGSDPVRLGHYFRIQQPERFARGGWLEIYRRVRFSVRVKLTIHQLGALR